MCTEDKHLIDIEKFGINSKHSEIRSQRIALHLQVWRLGKIPFFHKCFLHE